MTLKFELEPNDTDEILYTQAGRPTLDLRFASSKSLTDSISGQNLIDFTRGGNGVGTYVGSDGLIKNSVVNLLLRSEEFDVSPWAVLFSASITADQATSPNGANTADLLQLSNTNAFSGTRQNFNFSASTTYTFSVYARSVSGTSAFRLKIFDGVSDTFSANLAATTTWQRFSLTVTVAAGAGAGNAAISNVAALSADSLYIWGAQLEQSSTVGEYVKTTSSISGAARFDHNPTTGESLGLLVEEARSNLALRSEEFTVAANWVNSGSSDSANTAVAPNGITAADSLIENNAVGVQHYIQQLVTVAANTLHTVSVFVKADTRSSVRFGLLNNTLASGAFAHFNVGTGAIDSQFTVGTATSVSYSIEPYANGWYRCRTSCVIDASSTSAVIFIGLVNGSNNAAYDGDGTSGLYLWGAQLEAGVFPTSYIGPTTTAAVTRNADVAKIDGTAFSSWYRQDEGTVFADARSYFPGTQNAIATIFNSANSGNNRYSLRMGNTLVTSGGVQQAAFNPSNPVANTDFRLGFAYRTNDISFVPSYGAVSSDTSAILPLAVNTLEIGKLESFSTLTLNGTMRRLAYFDRRLPNTTLQAITSSTPPTTYGNLLLDSGNVPASIAGVAPTLDYRFARDKREIEAVSLIDKLTFSGDNKGTFVGSDGYIQPATTNVPRFNHDPLTRESLGLLVEEARTNLLLRSEEFDNASWTTTGTGLEPFGAGSIANAIAAPTGAITADKIAEDNSNSSHRVISTAPSWVGSTAYTYSFYAKAAERTQVYGLLGTTVVASRMLVIFNLSTGIATTSSGSPTATAMTNMGGGWYRCSITFTSIASPSGSVLAGIWNTAEVYTGTTGSGFYLWGAQLEAGSTPSSYIPTTTTAVTRTVDSATIDGTGILTGTYTIVEKPVGSAVESSGDIELQSSYTTERVMVFPTALSAQQITDIRSAM